MLDMLLRTVSVFDAADKWDASVLQIIQKKKKKKHLSKGYAELLIDASLRPGVVIFHSITQRCWGVGLR